MTVYLDHNATSPLRAEVRERLAELLATPLGNPSSLHAAGRRARALVDDARARVAAALGVADDEVVFTSGGTESNNLALRGAVAARGPRAGLVTSAIEHASVLETADALAREGRPVRLVRVDAAGRLDLAALERALAEPIELGVVSVQAANNEVGVVQPLARVAAAVRRARGAAPPLVHTDAVQALGRLPLALEAWGVDLATLSAHKVGGPVGVGVLVRRRGAALAPLARGGDQEAGLRPGTESTAAIDAAALALELAVREVDAYRREVGARTRALWEALARRVPEARLVGPPLDADDRLPNTLCVALPGHDGRVLVTRLDLEGLEASAGSACASGALEPSHVLLAMGHDERAARAGLRLSLGRATSDADVRRAVDVLARVAHDAPRARPERAG